MSDGNSLLTALLAVQQEVPTLPKDAINPHFRSKYTPLDTIVEHVGPILTKNALVWTTMPCRDDHGDPALRYRLSHATTGEVLEGTMPLLLTKADPQGMGSAITYARRYSLCAVLNLVADEDDDGNAGSSGEQRASSSGGKPSEKQLDYLKNLIKRHHPSKAQILAVLPGVEVEEGWTDKLSKGQVSTFIDALNDGLPADVEAPVPASDVPSEPELFTHTPAGDTSDTPIENAA